MIPRRFLTALLIICGNLPVGGSVRVALMDFDSDEASYSHQTAARDYSAALQAQMPKVEGIEWVERQDLSRAAVELELSLAFAATESAAARVGKWVKADWLVLGHFRRGAMRKPALHLEVLSLDHAEVLAEGSVEFQGDARPTYRALMNEAALAARSLATLLQQAATKVESEKTQTTVAWLSVGTAFALPVPENLLNDGIRRTIASLAPTLTLSGERSAAKSGEIRLLRFARPNRALDESELIVSGLVESDPASWLKVADFYVWGEITAAPVPDARGQRLVDRPMMVDIALHVWDGRTEPKTFREPEQVVEPGGWSKDATEALCDRLVRAAFPSKKPSSSLEPERGFRQQVAQMLVDRADKMTDRRSVPPLVHVPNSPENRRWLSEVVQTLEMACFFDPQNQAARGRLVSIRWNELAKWSARDRFRYEWQASEAWGRYVERFGLETPPVVRPPLASMFEWGGNVPWRYVQSAMTVAQWFGFSGAVQVDMPKDVRDHWHGKMAAELVKRVIAAKDRPEMSNFWGSVLSQSLAQGIRGPIPDPQLRLRLIEAVWPRYVDYINRTKDHDHSALPTIRSGVSQTLAETGRAGTEKTWFDRIDWIDRTGTPSRPSRASSPFDRSRLDGSALLRAPGFAVLPPEFALEPSVIHLPTDPDDRRYRGPMPVSSLSFFRGKLWIVASGEETVATPGISPELERDLTEVRARKGRLWTFDPGTQQVRNAPGGLGTIEVAAICAAGDRLWLAGDGVASHDPDTGQTKRFGVADGLEVFDTLALASTRGMLFVEGTRFEIACHDLNEGRWKTLKLPVPPSRAASSSGPLLSGAAGKMFCSAGRVWLYDTVDRSWTNLPEVSGIRAASGDHSGVWAGGKDGLYFLDITDGTRHSWKPRLYPSWRDSALKGVPYHPGADMIGPSLAGSKWDEDERVFWSFQRFQRERNHAHIQRRLGNRSVDEAKPGTRVPPGAITALLRDGEFLWIGCSMEAEHCLLLVHQPTFSWVGHLKLRDAVASLATSNDRLWIGLRGGNERLLQVDKRVLIATPRPLWRSDEVSEAEMTSAIERRSVREQARHAFFRGDYSRTAQLLEGLGSSVSDVETLFLLAYSHDSLGLAKPQAASRYFMEIISRHPDTAWARVAEDALAHSGMANRLVVETPPRAIDAGETDHDSDPQLPAQIDRLMKDLDRDGDGQLTAADLHFVFSVITTQLKAKPFGMMMPAPMAAWAPLISERLPNPDVLLLQYDTNCDDGLDSAELLALAKALRSTTK